MAYYQLYHNRVTCEIKITPLKKAFQNQPRVLEALEKAKGHYGQFDNAAKYIDPRHE